MGTQRWMETSKLQKRATGCMMLWGCSGDLQPEGRWDDLRGRGLGLRAAGPVNAEKVVTGGKAEAQHGASQQRLEAPGGQLIPAFGGSGTQAGRLEGVLTVRPHHQVWVL